MNLQSLRQLPELIRQHKYLSLLVLLLFIALGYGLRTPRVLVDSALVSRAPMSIWVEEEGRTRLQDRYQVSAPVSGYLNRVALEPGDKLEQGQVLFTINPAPADPLDTRSRAQAEANLARAQAALQEAQTRVDAQRAQVELASAELARIQPLAASGHVSADALDRARAQAQEANASLRSAHFSVDVARHELDNAKATLAVFSGGGSSGASGTSNPQPIIITSPISGQVLSRQRQSEGRVQAGEPIALLGDLNSLDVEVDLLSPDAVRVQPGMAVSLERWGGDQPLQGRVRRVDPAGFTRYSALGVEEQRVWVIVDITSPREQWQNLGDAYRVEARFVLWQGDEVLQVPSSALFREGDHWFAYVVESGYAHKRELKPGRRAGLATQIESGLNEGERVVLYPGEGLAEGARVKLR